VSSTTAARRASARRIGRTERPSLGQDSEEFSEGDDVERAKETVTRLEAELPKSTDRATALQTERRKLSLAAHNGDDAARRKLDKADRRVRDWTVTTVSLGWTFEELFNLREPFANVTIQGATWFVGSSTVTAVTADAITLLTEGGATQRIYRKQRV
jgi:hypothetical protein